MSVRARLAGRKRVRRRAVALAMLFLLLAPNAALCMSASAGGTTLRYRVSGDPSAPVRTAEELRRRWSALTVPAQRYDQTPCVCAPFRPGALHTDFIRQNLELINLFRYSAGLPLASCSDADNASAQYGAVLLAGTNTLDHSPARPKDMDAAFYDTACRALKEANIGCVRYGAGDERRTCAGAIPTVLRNYMNDGGSANRSCVPHRRWILYPGLQTVGVGCADSADGVTYHVLKVMDTQGGIASNADYDFVAWPASGAFPAQVLSPGAPWSVTLNPGEFEIPARDGLTVTIRREADGKTWRLDARSSRSAADESFLLVDTRRYGVGNCIVFAFAPGDGAVFRGDYRVTVEGLSTLDGEAAVLDYTVQFVDMEACEHEWSAGTVLEASGLYRNGCAESVCTRCGERKTEMLPLAVCSDENCPSSRFADAPAQGSWAHNGVDFVLERGIFSGTGPDTFCPKGSMTRAMMVTVLWRVAGMPGTDAPCAFADVKRGAYYETAVRWAAGTGLVKGISAGRFGPDEKLTRAQAVTLLRRFFAPEENGPDGALDAFADGQTVARYARDAFAWAAEKQIIAGVRGADGRLRLLPEENITREQAAAILMRCMTDR